jgi:hypothetical protein
MLQHFDQEVASVSAAIPSGPRLVVVGSASFWGADSCELCGLLAADLACLPSLIAMTGGMDGVGLTLGLAFAGARTKYQLPENLFHLLPFGFGKCSCGVTLGTGVDLYERREVLGRIGNACLVVEGGPGTMHEVNVATNYKVPIIPLGRSGGHAGELYSRMARPDWAQPIDWALLGDSSAQLACVSAAVRRLVETVIGSHASQGTVPGTGP